MHSSYFCSRKKYRAEKTTNKKERKKTETLGSTSSEAQPQTNSQKRYHCRHSYYVVGWAAKVLRECSGMGLSITGRCRSKRDQCNSQMLGRVGTAAKDRLLERPDKELKDEVRQRNQSGLFRVARSCELRIGRKSTRGTCETKTGLGCAIPKMCCYIFHFWIG